MGAAADAIADVIAPPPRAAEPRRTAENADASSFDDHLAAANSDNDGSAKPTDKMAKAPPSKDKADATKSDDDKAPDSNDAAVQAVAPTPEPAPQLTLQLMTKSDAEPAPTPIEGAAAQPCEAPPMADPAQAPTTPQQQTQPTHDAHARSAAAEESAQTKSQSEPKAADDATRMQTQADAPTPSPDAMLLASIAVAPSQPTQAPIAKSAQQLKIEPNAARSGDSNPVLPTAEGTAPTQEAPKPAASDEKSLPSFKDSLAALTADARENAAPSPAPAQAPGPAHAQASPAPAQPTAPATAPAEHAAAARAAPAAQVGQEIVRRFNGQSTTFDLRLDPPELGRVDVRLEVTRDHRVTATVSADSPQALTELVRHARALEQTLQSAGLELTDNGLSFDLNQSRQGFAEAQNDANPRTPSSAVSDEAAPPAIAARPLGLDAWRGVRIDVTA